MATDNGYGGAGGDGLDIVNNKHFKNHVNIIDESIWHKSNDNKYFDGGVCEGKREEQGCR